MTTMRNLGAPTFQDKACSACGTVFTCGAVAGEPCWCMSLPPLTPIDPTADCFCPACLGARVEAVARTIV